MGWKERAAEKFLHCYGWLRDYFFMKDAVREFCLSKVDRQMSPEEFKKKLQAFEGYILRQNITLGVLFGLLIIFLFDTIYSVCTTDGIIAIFVKLLVFAATAVWLFLGFYIEFLAILGEDIEVEDTDYEIGKSGIVEKFLEIEAEAYQEARDGYFNHIEKVTQSIRKEYGIKDLSGINEHFFARIAKDIGFEIEVLEEENKDDWPRNRKALCLIGEHLQHKKIILYKYDDSKFADNFTLAHEIGHVIYGIDIDFNKHLRSVKIDQYRYFLKSERDANYFAASLLINKHKLLRLLDQTGYDIAHIIDNHFQGSSFETMAHRIAAVSRIPFHAFRIDRNGKITKRFSVSGLNMDVFDSPKYYPDTAAFCCFNQKSEHYVGDGIFATIRPLPNRLECQDIYFCFAKQINGDQAFVLGCKEKYARKLKYYRKLQDVNPDLLKKLKSEFPVLFKEECPEGQALDCP